MPNADTPPVSAGRGLAWLALGGALLGGLGELAVRVMLYLSTDRVSNAFHLNPQAGWMAPLANLPLFAAAVGVVGLTVRREPTRRQAGLGVVLALAALEVGAISERVHIAALVLLAAGVGIQAARVARRWSVRLDPWIRRAVIALACVATLGGAAWNLRLVLGERRALASLSPARAGAPNVLFLILDTVGALELSLYGYHLDTSPNLSRLAADGIRFDQALAPAPWTLPSHASMFTGRYPHELSTGWYSPLDGAQPTLAERLRAGGYATGGFVGNLLYTNWMYGLDRGFLRYRDYALSVDETLYSSTLWRRLQQASNALRHRYDQPGRKTARHVSKEFLSWQRSIGNRPYFAFLNFFDAHSPYAPPAPFDTTFIGHEPQSRRIYQGEFPDSQVVTDLRLVYSGSVRYVDQEIQWLLDQLEETGTLHNTLVVITADHGEAFAEHGHLGHGTSLYLTQTRVPLVILLPSRPVKGLVVSQPVTLRDLPATILDLVNARVEPLPGRSLRELWGEPNASATPPRSPVISEVQRLAEFRPWFPAFAGDMRAIVDDGWHFIIRTDGKIELYRLEVDPLEQHNLAADPSHQDLLRSLRRKLDAAY